MNALANKVKESLDFLSAKLSEQPKIAIVLGSGLGSFAEQAENPISISTIEIPHYPISTVPRLWNR